MLNMTGILPSPKVINFLRTAPACVEAEAEVADLTV